MADKISVLTPEEEVNEKIKELGARISEEYAGKEVHMICICLLYTSPSPRD